MIPNKLRESRRVKTLKLPKNLERLYKEGKCRECAVVVTRMDFAKILGKFTKVKIQYESSKTPKTKQKPQVTSPNSNARLKSNENGMVLIHRNAYNQHPVKEPTTPKKTKSESPRFTPNILKENNRLKRTITRDKNSNYDATKIDPKLKQYGIVFEDPSIISNSNNDMNGKIALCDLLSQVDESILPSEDWCIDFFPKKGELKDDKVYDRIAAELEDLMFSEKPVKSEDKSETKVDDFPSIMDILNDNSSESKPSDQSSTLEFKPTLESSDVEAMLLGKTDVASEPIPEQQMPETPMDVDNPVIGSLIEDVNQFTGIQDTVVTAEQDIKVPEAVVPDEIENPHSPSILDETLQKGIEEHLPCNQNKQMEQSNLTNKVEQSDLSKDVEQPDLSKGVEQPDLSKGVEQPDLNKDVEQPVLSEEVEQPDLSENASEEKLGVSQETKDAESTEAKVIETNDDNIDESKEAKSKETFSLSSIEGITHLVFKKTKDGASYKTVTCPKNLKYDIELHGKTVEFIGAPKYISSIEDLQVLLQIVDESELDSLYVLH